MDWEVTLSDFSAGMLAQARSNLQAVKSFKFAVVEAQAIPFADNSLDAVIANHMLYHVPNRDQAYAEIHRVLKPGGCLYAATNGQFTMRQYDELIINFSPEAPQKHKSGEAEIPHDYFYLENGYVELSHHFSPVIERRYEDALVVTAAEPLVAYAESSGHLKGQPLLDLRQHVEEVIRSQSALYIDKIAGILVATKDSS
jgi:SAM-dependent methyltransferase